MEYLNDLNKEQLQAVTTTSNKVLVVAGAGSGKTKVLTTRIKYLLDIGVNPNQILAFTFTNRAAREMKYRLNNKFDNIYTFHGYSYRMLQFAKDELGFQKFERLNLVTEDYELQVIKDILMELDIKYNSKSILEFITKRKNNLEYKFKTINEARIYNQIYYKFQEYLQAHGQIDFDDMISLFLNNFDNLSFKEDILCTAKYILVDEFQDTNLIQYELLQKLSSKYNNLFCVGDVNQLIYSFRSSDVKIINDYKDQADEVIYLNQNYRCASNILEKANNLIRHNKNLKEDIYSTITPKYKIIYKEFPNTNYQAWYITHLITELITKADYKPNEIAVLYRNNFQSTEIEYELRKNNIPFYLYGKLKFFKNPSTKQMISLYYFLDNPEDYILFRQSVLIEEYMYEKIKKDYKTNNKKLLDLIIDYNHPKLSPIALNLKELINNKYKYDKNTLFEYLMTLVFDSPSNQDQEYLRALKDIIVNSELSNEKEILDNLLLSEDEESNKSGVNLMTIHKAKGLEFKCVFIISLNDGLIPLSIKTEADIKEERRLLYVAMTRAKEFLYLSSAEYHIINGQRKRLRPSLFVGEI